MFYRRFLKNKGSDTSETRKYGKGRISRLTLRILAINALAIIILFAGVLYLDRYEDSLIQSELEALEHQADLFANAIGEVAVKNNYNAYNVLSKPLVRRIINRSTIGMPTRSRVFDTRGRLLADSLVAPNALGNVTMKPLAPLSSEIFFNSFVEDVYEQIFALLRQRPLPIYREPAIQLANEFPEVISAMQGVSLKTVRATETDGLMLTVAVPIQKYKHVLGVLLLSVGGKKIDQAVRSYWIDIVAVAIIAALITSTLSIYLSQSITQPIHKLAAAAEKIKDDRYSAEEMLNFSRRNDEIGELGNALIKMTDNLWQRLDAIEKFSADVSHEIKNPLTSIRSAVETAIKISDNQKRDQLLEVILDDVHRLDRLITDISDSSRLDSELSRNKLSIINIEELLKTFHEIFVLNERLGSRLLSLHIEEGNSPFFVKGHEHRLIQVINNLVDNALTFSSPNGEIKMLCDADNSNVIISIEDQGPGIPSTKLDSIFERFYTERPLNEKFGIHSGLGLSICKQIIDAHGGQIWVENLLDRADRIKGARFFIKLPKTN